VDRQTLRDCCIGTMIYVWLRIPTEAGQGYRFDVGHHSDFIPATCRGFPAFPVGSATRAFFPS
jgi:hypothetical protein